jgi:hypothetical protein
MKNEVKLEEVSKPVFGITSRRYRELAHEEIVPPVTKGKIDFVKAAKALIEYYRRLAEGQGSLSLTDVRTRKESARAEREELIVKRLKEELVPKNAAITWLVALGSATKLAFQGLPKRLAPIVRLYDDEKEIEVIIRNEIYKIIRELEKPLDATKPRNTKKRNPR